MINTNTLEHELIATIKRLNTEKQRKMLEFARTLDEPTSKTYTARELLRLPMEERNRIVKAMLERTLNDDVEVFEANSEADFDDE